MLTRGPVRSRALAHHHDIRVGAVAQVARHGGLGHRQQFVVARQRWQHVAAQLGHTQPGRRVHLRLPVLHGALLVAQQDEVPVGQPAQQGRDVAPVITGEPAVVVGVERVGQPDERGVHRGRIELHRTGVGQGMRQHSGRLGDGLAVPHRRQLHMNPGLVDTVGRGAGVTRRTHRDHLARRIPPHPELRTHDRGVGDTDAVQQHHHRVHQQRAVIGHDLQRRAEAAGIVGRVDRDQRLPRRPAMTEAIMRGQQLRGHPGRHRDVDRGGDPTIGRRTVVGAAVGEQVCPCETSVAVRTGGPRRTAESAPIFRHPTCS
ncbi:Uncharacterised protein [Mycobacteroides abscessus subsp. abscessus]|nr:Uncharacterised protein [Mycobacteroides abscessus subsp. abscessus]